MKLNHLNLVVSDVLVTTHFFESYFDFRCIDKKGDNFVSILIDEEEFTLVLMKSKEGDPVYPGAFHIGFMQNTMESVSEIYSKLMAGGIAVGQEPRKIRDSFGFYFSFENIMIEVGHYY